MLRRSRRTLDGTLEVIGRYVVRRIAAAIPVFLGVTAITFLLIHVASAGIVPGLELNASLRPEDVARIRANLGLDDPLWLQYWRWMSGLVRGDFGRSLVDGSSVIDHILERLPATLELTMTSIVLGVLVAVPLGVISAVRRGTFVDGLLTLLSVAGVSIPQFWLGMLMIFLFSVSFQSWGLPWLPSSGAASSAGGGDPVDRLAHLVMPTTVLAFSYIAIWSRFTRSSMLEALAQDYVRVARAKGLGEGRVRYVHALRNALMPLATLLGLELPGLFAGGAIVEIVFSWPGIGRLALERALQYDYTMVLGITTFAAVIVILGSLVADILYAVLDPRIRHA